MPISRVLLAIVFLTTVCVHAGETERKEGLEFLGTGPLRIREQFLIGIGYYAFEPVSADVLGLGELQMDVVQSDTNTFARSRLITGVLEARKQRGRVDFADLRAVEAPRGESCGESRISL